MWVISTPNEFIWEEICFKVENLEITCIFCTVSLFFSCFGHASIDLDIWCGLVGIIFKIGFSMDLDMRMISLLWICRNQVSSQKEWSLVPLPPPATNNVVELSFRYQLLLERNKNIHWCECSVNQMISIYHKIVNYVYFTAGNKIIED